MNEEPSFSTATVRTAYGHTEFLFLPTEGGIEGLVRVDIESKAIRPGSPRRHPKVRQALSMASAFHPNHAVSVRLSHPIRQDWHRSGRDFFKFRVP